MWGVRRHVELRDECAQKWSWRECTHFRTREGASGWLESLMVWDPYGRNKAGVGTGTALRGAASAVRKKNEEPASFLGETPG